MADDDKEEVKKEDKDKEEKPTEESEGANGKNESDDKKDDEAVVEKKENDEDNKGEAETKEEEPKGEEAKEEEKDKAEQKEDEDKKDEVEKEELKEDETEKEESKEDETKKEEPKDKEDETKKEEPKEDDTKKEEPKEDDTKKEEEVEDDKKESKEEEEGGDDVKEEMNVEEEADTEDKKDAEKEEDKPEDMEVDEPAAEGASPRKRGRPKKDAISTPETSSAKADDADHSGKRRRKSSSAYVPEDFTEGRLKSVVFPGRGTKLRDIRSVKEKIDSHPVKAEILETAHKFLYGSKGKVPKTRKDHILDFTGYLPPIVDGEDEAAREKKAENEEAKWSRRAYKLNIAELKRFCDLFDIDRSPAKGEKIDKDALVDRLLDFLGAPDTELTAAFAKKGKSKAKPSKSPPSKKKSTPSKKGGKRGRPSKSYNDTEEDDESDYGDGEIPSDDELIEWVEAFVKVFNSDKVTVKSAIKIGSAKFGVNLKPVKSKLKKFITDAL